MKTFESCLRVAFAGVALLAALQLARGQSSSTPNPSSPNTAPPSAAPDSGPQNGAASSGRNTGEGAAGQAEAPGAVDQTVRRAPVAAVSSLAGIEIGGEDTSKDLPLIPGLLGGTGISSSFVSELERKNFLRGGLNVGAAYDSNPLLAPSAGSSNTSVSIFPNIEIEESTSRARWTLGYAGGLTINENLSSDNQESHNLNFDSQWRLSPHVNLRVAERFSMVTGFFDSGPGSSTIGAGGPNASLITPLATQRSSLSTVETNYHFALNDLVGASASFFDSHFSSPGTVDSQTASTPLTNSASESGSAFWLHRVFRGDWLGASYRFDRLTFSVGNGESLVHSFYAVNTMNLSDRFTLTGFVGPQYSDNNGFTPGSAAATETTNWSAAGGIEGGWRNQRTSATAGYSRSISDGGGVLGAVRLQSVYGSFRREIAPGWAAAVNGSYGSNLAILVPTATSASSIDLTSAGVALERNVGKSLGLHVGYTHDFEQQANAPCPTNVSATCDASRNRFFVTLSYQWAKPLGL